MVILITGGAGFIGSNLIHYWLTQNPGDTIVNFDALTYAGNLANLAGVESNRNYHFFQGDLRKQEQLDEVFEQFSIDSVIHLAADPMSTAASTILLHSLIATSRGLSNFLKRPGTIGKRI